MHRPFLKLESLIFIMAIIKQIQVQDALLILSGNVQQEKKC